MITLSEKHKKLKEKYLEENPELDEIKDGPPSLLDLTEIEEDDEVWLVQCPSKVDITQLKSAVIKLPGKSRINDIETVSEIFSTPKCITLASKSSNDGYKVKTLQATGRILVRARLKDIGNKSVEDKNENDNLSLQTPIPVLKQRHPLLGANFEEKLILNKKIVKRLRHADEETIIKREPINIKTEKDDEDSESTISKRRKKNKDKRKIDADESLSKSQGKKAKQNSMSKNSEESVLAWIKEL